LSASEAVFGFRIARLAGRCHIPAMCNDFGNRIPYDDYLRAFSEIRVPLRWPTAAPNLEPETISGRPTQHPSFAAARTASNWFSFAGASCRPDPRERRSSIFASEGRRFPKGRCLIPASHFFEFTGPRAPKSKWKFTKAGEDWFCFAGLWRPMLDGKGDAFTLLTTDPGPDVAPIHDRQMVILDRADWLAWLDLTRPEAELLRLLPAGSLAVEQVR
jgi:putative SOS response-associated peptidase YedK